MQSKSYSQNGEDSIIIELWENKYSLLSSNPTVLEIGANSGIFLSNSKALIELGWSGVLVEPSSVFGELEKLHADNDNVICINKAIAGKRGELVFMESGAHVAGGDDKALVSTSVQSETVRWKRSGVKFEHTIVEAITFNDLLKLAPGPYDFISIDVEGMEMEILQQIDLNKVGCKMLCIEWNGRKDLFRKFVDYCARFGMKLVHTNAENLIFAL